METLKRSPVDHLSKISETDVSLDINAGINDGRLGSVPFWHSLAAFDAVLSAEEKLGEEWIMQFYETQQPSQTEDNSIVGGIDALYEEHSEIHYRNEKDFARVTIFEGAHDIVHSAAIAWLAEQRRGQPSVWDLPSGADQDVDPLN